MASQNPIISGFAPDPSIVRMNDTFYLVNSSFHLFPGLPIFASKDLVSWQHIGNAINRPTQLSLSKSGTKLNPITGGSGDKAPATGGLYAPTIRAHRGIIYIVCTNVVYQPAKDNGDWVSGLQFDNFIISTSDIRLGEWSDPIYFDFHGIDPDLFFDDDGSAYISGSSWTPSPSCCISCFEIDIATGQKKTKEKVLWHGYTRIIPEGPHIYKRDGYYYLLIAEGGTHQGHCISISRAPNIWAPYESCSQNPILAPTLGLDSLLYCHYNGHGDLVRDSKGAWWLVCLGVRRDREGRMVLGRETFLAAVDWQKDQAWPRIQQPILRAQRYATTGINDKPEKIVCLSSTEPVQIAPSPFLLRKNLVWIRNPDFSRCQGSQDGKAISLLPSPTDLGQCTGESTSFVGKIVRHFKGISTVDLLVPPVFNDIQGLKVGLAYYKDEYRYSRILYEPGDQAIVFEIANHSKDPPIVMGTRKKLCYAHITKIQFRIVYTEQHLHFLYRVEEGDERDGWHSCGLVDTLDMTGEDFTGPVIGVFAIGEEETWCNFENVNL